MNKIKLNKKGIFIFVVFILLIALVIISLSISGPGDVVKKYAKGMKNFDSEKIVELYIPEMIKESYDSEKEMIDELDLMFKEMKEKYFKIISYSIDTDYKVFDGEELEYRIKQLKDYYKIEDEIKEVRRYLVEFQCSVDGEEDVVEHKVIIAKIKSKWYLIGIE